jgi:hypothetical protein
VFGEIAMTDIQEKKAIVEKIIDELAKDALNARSRFPDYGRSWGPWHAWDGSSEFGPDDAEGRLVNVYRCSPMADHYLVAEVNKIEWLHIGGPNDVTAFRFEFEVE